MANKMGTLTDNKDGKAPSDMTQASVSDTAAMEDRIPCTETPHGQSPTTSNAGNYVFNTTVIGSKDSTCTETNATGVQFTINNNEKEQEGLACDVTEGEKPKLKISVPAEDGGTMIHVHCTNGKVRHWSYCRNVDIEKTLGSTWTFGNIFDGFMATIINGKIGDDFFDLIGKWMKLYGCQVYRVYKRCLVIEFLHETEEGRDRMIKDKETVKQMFQTFIEVINPNAPSCTLEVSTEKETTPLSDKPDAKLKHIEQDVSEDVSVPSTSKSEQVQAQGMMPREYKKEEQFQSISDDESERPLRKEMEYSVERRKHDRFPDEEETSSSFDSDEEETSSSFDSSSFKGARRWASEPGKIREKEPTKSRATKSRGKIKERIPDEEETSSSFYEKIKEQRLKIKEQRPERPFGARPLASQPRELQEERRKIREKDHLSGMASGRFVCKHSVDLSDMASRPFMGENIVGEKTVGARRWASEPPDEEETSFFFEDLLNRLPSVPPASSYTEKIKEQRQKIKEQRQKIKEQRPERPFDVHLEPIPVSQVHLHDCRRCSEVFKNCENELSAVRNLHFIHFDPYNRHDSKLQFTKILSAFRNSQGGVLIVHQRNARRSVDSLHKFINQILDSVLTNDLVTCDVFKSQQIENYEDMFRIDVEPAEMYVTHDYKTKFPSLSTDKFENASNERIRHLLFSLRTTESTEAALKGISSRQQNEEDLWLRYTRPISMLSSLSTPSRDRFNVLVDDIDVDDIDVDDIMNRHSVPEHITSLSKKKGGGTMFVAMAGLKFDYTPLDQQELIKDHLMQALKKNVCVQKNKHSKVSLQDIDVFKIGLSKDADSGGCIIEIAVGHVNGCVFYDPQGPESYKIEGGEIVRLPIERWVEEAFD